MTLHPYSPRAFVKPASLTGHEYKIMFYVTILAAVSQFQPISVLHNLMDACS